MEKQQYEDQLYDLQKQLRMKEAAAKKDKAIYEQRIELLEIQLKEYKEREENMRKMHETMISALKQPNMETNTTPKMLELANEMHKKDLMELKTQHAETVGSLERQLAELKTINGANETSLKELSQQNSELQAALEDKEKSTERQIKEFEETIRKLKEDKKTMKDAIELDAEMKISSMNQELEKLKEEHTKDLNKVKTEYENSLADIKYIYEQEKTGLEGRLEKATQELKALQALKENAANNSVIMRDMQNNYLLEIQELNAHLDAFKKQSYEEIASLKKQRDEAYKKVESILTSKSSARGSVNGKGVKGKSKSSAIELSEGIQKELGKLRKQNNDLKGYVAKLENSEKRLKALLSQKENNGAETGRSMMGKQTTFERTNSSSRTGRRKVDVLTARGERTPTLERDEVTELNVAEYTNEQTKGNDACLTESIGGYRFKTEHESAKKTKPVPPPSDTSDENIEIDCEPFTTKATEEVLKDMTSKMERLQKQRDKVQTELDKVTAELSTAKSQRALFEAKKAETETSLKADIKTLIGKLMQTKEKIALNLKGPIKHQRSVSTYGKSLRIKKETDCTGPTNVLSKEPSKQDVTDDDTVNNNCSDDLDEYESNQVDECNSLSSSAKKMPEFHKKSLHN